MYGPFTNETLIGQAIKGRRDQVVLAPASIKPVRGCIFSIVGILALIEIAPQQSSSLKL